MDLQLRDRIQGALGRRVVAARPSEGGGYTPAERWLVTFDDGGTAFAKVGTTEPTAQWVRWEHRWIREIGARCMPRLLGLADHPERPALVSEDLSGAHWPPPWRSGDVERVREAVAALAATRPLPPTLPSAETLRPLLSGWAVVDADRAPFLALGLVSPSWLDAALPTLVAAEAGAVLAGEDLVHFDMRSDNLCLTDDRVVVVDWNMPHRGNRLLDLVFWGPSLRMEGGPLPEALAGPEPAFAAGVAGFFAARASGPPIPDAPRVRWIQLRQLRQALPWACRALALPPPDLPWAQRILVGLDSALEAGTLTETAWFDEVEEALVDAYLGSDDPRAQSGKSGDEADWRWSRGLILDAVDGDVDLLDVGCANGYLMRSLERWAAERGRTLRAHGLEISARLAGLARATHPELAGRIHVGNVLNWQPPRRYDVVHTGLDYVPPRRRSALLDRLLARFVVPGGAVVLRPERVGPDTPDVVAMLAAMGRTPHAVLEARHPLTGAVRRTAVLR